MEKRTLRGRTAIVGIGESKYYRHGKSPEPEFKLALRAILAACEDAGLDPRDIDGFSAHANDRNEATRLATALGVKELRFAGMQWGGGGGGACAGVANAAAAVATGMADCVVAFRALAQGEFGRLGRATYGECISGERSFFVPYGMISAVQRYSPKVMRFMVEHGIGQDCLRAIALASYHHAQTNPRAVMYGRPLDEAKYDASRWIAEPHHLFDCCQENDGAAAAIIVSAERAKDLRQKPAYLLGAAAGGQYRAGATAGNTPDFASAHFQTLAPHAYRMAGIGPKDVDVVQCYENFTGGVLMALLEHGLFTVAEASDVLRLPNLIAPAGRLPLNTSGGNLAECYVHGFELNNEAVRQIRGQSTNQVPGADVALVIGGPMVTPASNAIYGSEATL